MPKFWQNGQTMKISSLQKENRINQPPGQNHGTFPPRGTTRAAKKKFKKKKKKKPNLGIFMRPLEDEVHLFGRLFLKIY